MPEVSNSTRADNDNFDDGTPNEYKVENCALVLFKGSSESGKTESDATFQGFYDITAAFQKTPSSTGNITSSAFEVREVNNIDLKGDNDLLYGLVLVNYDATRITSTKAEEFKVNGTPITTFGALQALKLTDAGITKFYNGEGENASKFFMTNAPLSTKAGGDANPTTDADNFKIFTLAPLNKDAIKNTEDEARANPAGCIYVERAVAKVTGQIKDEVELTTTNAEGSETKIKFTAKYEWALGNTEADSYLIRNVKDLPAATFGWDYKTSITSQSFPTSTNSYRMVGEKSMGTLSDPFHTQDPGTTNPNHTYLAYRTYWCVDPTYNENHTDYVAPSTFTNIVNEKGESVPLYCNENTFGVGYQTHKNTTRVVIKVTLTPKTPSEGSTNNLYIIGDKNNIIYTSEADVTSAGIKYIQENSEVQAAVNAAVKKPENGTVTIDFTKAIKVGYVKGEDGILKATSITLSTEGQEDAFETAEGENNSVTKFNAAMKNISESILAFVNKSWKITEYTGGVSYYEVYIEHFGDEGCPLPDNWKGTNVDAVYGYNTNAETASKNYLGRYGMVRNNWYDVKISNIVGLGEPVVPNGSTDISDDNKEDKKWIALEIHTLSWAKRTQGTVLGE